MSRFPTDAFLQIPRACNPSSSVRNGLTSVIWPVAASSTRIPSLVASNSDRYRRSLWVCVISVMVVRHWMILPASSFIGLLTKYAKAIAPSALTMCNSLSGSKPVGQYCLFMCRECGQIGPVNAHRQRMALKLFHRPPEHLNGPVIEFDNLCLAVEYQVSHRRRLKEVGILSL